MLIDTSFDFRTETRGRDPDTHSPTLRQYHKLLWSKTLPGGALFDLSDTVPRKYLHHCSALGEFCLTSDTIIHSYSKTKLVELRYINELFSQEENEAFRAIGSTIGGRLVFPGNRIDGKRTINGDRGCHPRIKDRFDLTLECIRRHYIGHYSPLEDTFKRYGDFFALFENFRGYVEFFMLQDLVDGDYSAVKFLIRFDDFSSPPLPNVDNYREYRRLSIEFAKARNLRIDRYAALHNAVESARRNS
jgi:hypothetical protein